MHAADRALRGHRAVRLGDINQGITMEQAAAGILAGLIALSEAG
jgi:hypothetical protein